MIFRNLFYSFSILLLLSFSVKADEFNRQDISTITIHRIHGYDFLKSLIIKITANSIIIPHGFCNDKECPTDGQDIEYIGHHDVFKFVPEKYLSESSRIDPIEYDSWGQAVKLEICITDGRCHSWNYKNSSDKEITLFYNKLWQIQTGKSEYQFHPKTIPALPKVVFDKKDLTLINIYQLTAYPFTEVLLYTITADSITLHPYKFCYLYEGDLQCQVKSEKVKYQDEYNIFKDFPTLFLSGSNFIDLREYGIGYDYIPLFKIEGCFTDGHCNIWDIYASDRDYDIFNRYHDDIANRYHDNETKVFMHKIMQFYYTPKNDIKN